MTRISVNAKVGIAFQAVLSVLALISGFVFRTPILGLVCSLALLYLAYDIYKSANKRK